MWKSQKSKAAKKPPEQPTGQEPWEIKRITVRPALFGSMSFKRSTPSMGRAFQLGSR